MIKKFLITRYLFSKRQFQFISFITWISVAGIAIGVATLIIILSIFNGFEEFTENQILGYEPHLIIFSNNDLINNYLKNEKKILNFTLVNEKKVLISTNNNTGAGKLISISNQLFLDKFQDKSRTQIIGDGVLIGGELSRNLKIRLGDQINLTSPEQIETSVLRFAMPEVTTLNVDGVFYSNTRNYDQYYIVKRLNNEQANRTYINLVDPYKSELIKSEIQRKFPNVNIETWEERNKTLLGIMEFESYATFLILLLIIIIALFNLFASLSMTSVEKQKDFAILQVLGLNKIKIRDILVTLGWLTGLLGIVAGLIIGILFIYLQKEYSIIMIGVENYISQPLPIKSDIVEIFIILVVSLILTYFSSGAASKIILKQNLPESLSIN